MGKPLLTDEIIEQAKRGQLHLTDYPYEAIDGQYDRGDSEQVEEWLDEEESQHIYKSRRIENVKRQAVRSKLNMILLLLLLVLALVMYAVFNW